MAKTTNINDEKTKPISESKVELNELPSNARELNEAEADAVRGGLANLKPVASAKGSIIWES